MTNEEIKNLREFQNGLRELINIYSIENIVDMPDFLIAEMLCGMIESMSEPLKKNLDWHGCDSVCHPKVKE